MRAAHNSLILFGEGYRSVGKPFLLSCNNDAELDLLGVSNDCFFFLGKSQDVLMLLAYGNNATTLSACCRRQISLQALALFILNNKHLLNKVCLEYSDVRANVCDCGQDDCDTIIQAGLSSFTETDLPNGV